MIAILFKKKDCAPCEEYKEHWEAVKEELSSTDIRFFEHWDDEEVAFQDRLGITGYPTTVVINTTKYEGPITQREPRNILTQ